MSRRLRIDAHLCGPPGTANGGVVAGTLAGAGPAEVTIRRPVPVGADLHLHDGRLLGADGAVLAESSPLDEPAAAALEAQAATVPRVPVAAARAAAARTPLAEGHPFPGCFGCGPEHPAGLHCLAGPAADDGTWAVAFTPRTDDHRLAWAALDCPSSAPHAVAAPKAPLVLGGIAGRILRPLAAGEPHVVVARATGSHGRRHDSVSVLLGPDGEPTAHARATWITLRAA